MNSFNLKSRPVKAIAGVLLVSVALTGCQSTKNLFGGKTKDANAPVELVALTPTVNAVKMWSANVGKGEGNIGARQGVSTDGTHVYAASMTGGVRALDAATGRVLWTHNTTSKLSSGPGVGDGVVVVGGLNGEVIALDATTGTQKWIQRVSNEVIAAPAVGQGLALVRSNDGRVTAFDLNSGERRWFAAHDMPALTVRGNDSVTMGPGVAFVGNDDGTMTALVLSSGQSVFDMPIGEMSGRSDLDRLADVDGAPVLDGSTLYATSFRNSTIAMDGPSGRMLWQAEHGGVGRAAVSPTIVAVADRKGTVWGLDKSSGAASWKNESLKNRRLYSPVVHGDYIAVGDYDGYIHWLRQDDGALAGRARAGKAAIKGNPVVSGDVLYVQDTDGTVSAFRLGQ